MDAENVLVGSGLLYVAPIGTALPDLTETPVTWPVGWVEVGYTEDGVEIQHAPTFKDIEVDEEMDPVKTVLTGNKMTVAAKLAEATLENMKYAIPGSTITTVAAGVSNVGSKTLKFGSPATVPEALVGFQGTSPEGFERVFIMYRGQQVGTMASSYKKADKVLVPVEFRGLADSSKPKGERLGFITDITEDHT